MTAAVPHGEGSGPTTAPRGTGPDRRPAHPERVPGTEGPAGAVVVEGLDAFRAEVLESALPVVVDFGAPWCAPCRAIAPVMDELARELTGRVKVVTVNTDDNQEIARAYGIVSIPTLYLFEPGGELARTMVGAMPKRDIRKWITEPEALRGTLRG